MASKETIARVFFVCQQAGLRAPKGTTPAGMAEVWALILGDLDDAAVLAAVVTYVGQAREFWPAPGVIRQLALDRLCGTPAEAYQVAMQAMRTHGCSRLAKRGHATEAIQQTVTRIGGWQAMNTDNDFAKREMCDRFIAAFDAARNDNPVSAVLPDNQAKRLALAGE